MCRKIYRMRFAPHWIVNDSILMNWKKELPPHRTVFVGPRTGRRNRQCDRWPNKMKTIYCWKCQKGLPMLDKREWARFEPIYTDCLRAAKDAKGKGMSDAEVITRFAPALSKWREMTGYEETEFERLWHHQLAKYGKPCKKCGKPLRTPKARFCAACGAKRGLWS